MLSLRKSRNLKSIALSVIAAAGLGLFAPAAASAADTTVGCAAPVVWTSLGYDGTTPRLTIQCTKGSTAGNITYFAVPGNLAAALVLSIEREVNGWIQFHGLTSTITLTSNLSDTSGVSIGCGGANCRLLDQVKGN